MNNKLNIFFSFLLLALLCSECKNKAVEYYEFNIINDTIQSKLNGVEVRGSFEFGDELKGIDFLYGFDKKLVDAISKPLELDGFEFSVSIDSLTLNTWYYYCYKVDFGINKYYLTKVDSFCIGGGLGLPKVETIKVGSNENELSYKVYCNVVSDGGATISERGIYWNTNGNPGVNDHKVKHAENGVGEYICLMDSLEPNTTYFVRAYAKNEKGIGIGNIIDFTTGNGPGLPEVITLEVSDTTVNSARCGGEVINNGGAFSISSRGVCWSTAPVPTIDDDHTVDGNGFGAFVSNVTNLASNTTYNIRAYAIVNDQNNTIAIDTVYGEIKSFTTLNGVGPNTPVTVAVIAAPTIIPKGGSSQLKASASGGDGNYSYSWTPAASLDNPNIQSPIASPTVTTTYTCTVTSDNTTASSSCTITVVKAPGNLQATVQNGNDVQLTWTNADPAQTYKIYRNDTFLTQTAFTIYVDSNLSPGAYRYKVTTLYEGVESPESNEAIVEITTQIPEGVIDGLFSVTDSLQVYFSQGNLQFKASPQTWRFAENQWDYVGDANSGTVYEGGAQCSNTNIAFDYTGWIDLFGWGTSGYDHGAQCHQPWGTSDRDSWYYAYGNPANNLNAQSGKADWGYNAILNGGNEEHKGWRTLTSSEWNWLLNQRQTPSNIRYAKAKLVNIPGHTDGVAGLVILPDNWDASNYTLNNPNVNSSNYDSNTITADDWINMLQSHGAVFLPAGGRRHIKEVTIDWYGYYWSSNQNGESVAYNLHFKNGSLIANNSGQRHFGFMVRLVFDKP